VRRGNRFVRIFLFPRKILWTMLILSGAGIGGSLYSGYILCKSSNHSVSPIDDPVFRRIEITGKDGGITAAWSAPGSNGKGIILAHGNSSDRNAMVPRMRFFHSLGYSVIAPDLNAHGETLGNWKTFGYLESKDIAKADAYLREKMESKWVAAIGTSLGGASILKAESDGVEMDAIIIESVFSDIRTAAKNRLEMRIGKIGVFLEPLLTAQIPIWLGVSRDELSPVQWARTCHAPILFLSGDSDLRAKPRESQAIYSQVPALRKRIIIVPGARHVDLYAFNKIQYERDVMAFLMEIQADSAPQ
jgi:uncharacterized protein